MLALCEGTATHCDVCTEGTAAHVHVEELSRTQAALQSRTGKWSDHGTKQTFAKVLYLTEIWKATNSPRGSKGTHQWWSNRWSIISCQCANENRVMEITDNPDDTQCKTQYYPVPHLVEDQCFVTLGSLSPLAWSSGVSRGFQPLAWRLEMNRYHSSRWWNVLKVSVDAAHLFYLAKYRSHINCIPSPNSS